jgi:hypothetical protein
MVAYFVSNPIVLTGPSVIINVDEIMVNFKTKSHRGRGPREQVYALVIVDTLFTPAREYCEIVPHRSKRTLLPIIARVVRSNSIIYSDEWAA